MLASQLTTKARTRRTNSGNCANGAQGTRSSTSTSIRTRAGRALKTFAALFEDAHKRQFDTVLFWSLDRFSREGMVPTIMHLQRLASHGIGFHSYTEAH